MVVGWKLYRLGRALPHQASSFQGLQLGWRGLALVVGRGGLMQRWAYRRIWTASKLVEVGTEERSMFGGTKTKQEYMWVARYDGREMPLTEVLDKCGDEGWELVNALWEHSGCHWL